MEGVYDSEGVLTEVCEARRCSAGSSLVWRCVDCDSTYCRYEHHPKPDTPGIHCKEQTDLLDTVTAGRDKVRIIQERKGATACRTRKLI